MMMSIERHVHRHHTVSELQEADRCLVCGGAAHGATALDFAHGASTLYMKHPLPEVQLCAMCSAAQLRAMGAGKRALVAAYLLPPLLVALVALTTPLDTPLVIAGVALAALALARVTFALVRRARALEARVLYIDGAEDQLILQLGLLERGPDAGYRDAARDVRDDGRITKMHGARVSVTLGFLLSTIATGLTSLVGWFGAYPILVIDDSSALSDTARIDGKKIISFKRGRMQAIALPYGHHTITFGSGPPIDLELPFGRNRLVTSDPTRCFQIRWRAPSTSNTPPRADSEILRARGGIFSIDHPDDVALATCPAQSVSPW